MIEVPLLIAGRDEDASGGASFERANPVSGEVVSRAAATVEDAERAAAEAAEAFPALSAIGCSGARILGTLARELRRRGGRWGLAAICIGVGQGLAVVLEA